MIASNLQVPYSTILVLLYDIPLSIRHHEFMTSKGAVALMDNVIIHRDLKGNGSATSFTFEMPPFIPRKRRHSDTEDAPAPKSLKKDSLFDAVDAPARSTTLQDHKTFLDRLNYDEGSLSEFTELSEPSDSEFEKEHSIHEPSDNEDEQGWEDAIPADQVRQEDRSEEGSGDTVLNLNLNPDAHAQFISSNPYGKKKGPTKIERQSRVFAHCLHVQFLLFHNLIRNSWCCDKETQNILVNQLPPAIKKEVDRWRALSCIEVERPSDPLPLSSSKRQQRRPSDGLTENVRNQRDWGKHAEKQERGVQDLSRGDPLIRLLKVIASYWRKKFTITAPSLRKQGYKSLAVLAEELFSFKNEEHDPEKHGERLVGVHQFRQLAESCKGSRDVGAQLFTTLVRGLGIETRLVASLQPVGLGWSKWDDASVTRNKNSTTQDSAGYSGHVLQATTDPATQSVQPTVSLPSKPTRSKVPKNRMAGGRRAQEISSVLDISDDDSDAPKVCSTPHSGDSDDELLVDLTLSSPAKKLNNLYDRDLLFPTYWTEATSPITNDIFPVEAFFLSPAVATCDEHLAAFEPTGAKAEKAKQVFAYVVGYSSDGTAKDVTTRYLRRHVWPGKTKGVRLPVEKVAVYNQRGKIIYRKDYDWFKHVMSGYMRTSDMRTVVDDLEEAKDLKRFERQKKEVKEGRETLQSYKTSADFVLERHLRREEAILPGSKPVKTFLAGKGENVKEEPVYNRKDVAICRTGESWHKEGRQVKDGEQPIKMVPVRAVTLNRKREVEEAERAGGEKIKQGLYALNQTDWIIPPPIQNGVIPKNAFGNMDCYVPTMIPEGAVHIPLKSTSKICKRLNIDFAEACTGFEFGNQRAVPVITGVVVAVEHEELVIAEWEKDEMQRKAKEEAKKQRITLTMWRKMLVGLKIMKRVNEDYGTDVDGDKTENVKPFINKDKAQSNPKNPENSTRPAENRDGTLANANQYNDIGEDDHGFSEAEGGGFIIEPESSMHDTERGAILEESIPELEIQMNHNTDLPSGSTLQNPSEKQIFQSKTYHKSKKQNLRKDETLLTKKANSTFNPKEPATEDPPPTPKLTDLTPKAKAKTTARARARAKTAASTSPTTKETPESRRTAPKRAAAVRSERAVKSHYFVHDSDDHEHDDQDSSEDSEPGHDSSSSLAAPIVAVAVVRKKRGRSSLSSATR